MPRRSRTRSLLQCHRGRARHAAVALPLIHHCRAGSHRNFTGTRPGRAPLLRPTDYPPPCICLVPIAAPLSASIAPGHIRQGPTCPDCCPSRSRQSSQVPLDLKWLKSKDHKPPKHPPGKPGPEPAERRRRPRQPDPQVRLQPRESGTTFVWWVCARGASGKGVRLRGDAVVGGWPSGFGPAILSGLVCATATVASTGI